MVVEGKPCFVVALLCARYAKLVHALYERLYLTILQPYRQQRACNGSVLLGRGIGERLFGNVDCVPGDGHGGRGHGGSARERADVIHADYFIFAIVKEMVRVGVGIARA